MLTIGTLAKTFGCLPSQVRDQATTYDLMIYDVMMAWEKYQSNPNDAGNFDQQDLVKMMESVR